ncbi:Hypothetical predicted protein [Mytilus galloprovincialis]|uniref:Kringle domain-containing protein n=1 Tax=Mytilus galloprovincialis TaxID=29158 RepID=A0A8B6BXE4_MYTGA|nr:Hypothetical predicted protein [Mytilus galloprovincialis]
MGTENMTRTCIPCQRWDSDFPQHHIYTESMKDHENYCRNPDQEPEGPWCYTMDPGIRFDFCDVQFCGLTPAVSSHIKCKRTTTYYTTAAYVNETTDSAVSPTQLPEDKIVSQSRCECRCYTNEQFISHSTNSRNHNYTNTELKQQMKEELREISEQLKVQKNLTSAWVRARRCADDQRMASVGMGYVAIVIIAMPFILTFVSDCCKLK